MKRKILSLMLVLCMALSLFAISVFADDADVPGTDQGVVDAEPTAVLTIPTELPAGIDPESGVLLTSADGGYTITVYLSASQTTNKSVGIFIDATAIAGANSISYKVKQRGQNYINNALYIDITQFGSILATSNGIYSICIEVDGEYIFFDCPVGIINGMSRGGGGAGTGGVSFSIGWPTGELPEPTATTGG